MKNVIKKIPILDAIAQGAKSFLIPSSKSFSGSENYWKNRYEAGGTSGEGSYDELADFKAEVLNGIVKEKGIQTVIEYGCGDGNQLTLAEYPSYIGFDVSAQAISRCEKIFSGDKAKSFGLSSMYSGETAQLTMSLDVIYHLVEEEVFLDYMGRLFDSSAQYVVIYSSNTDRQEKGQAAHVKHRKFSNWIKDNARDYKEILYMPNRYPVSGCGQRKSSANFYLYERH